MTENEYFEDMNCFNDLCACGHGKDQHAVNVVTEPSPCYICTCHNFME